jgi:hypothetical protein
MGKLPDAERRPVAGAPTEGLNHSTEPATEHSGPGYGMGVFPQHATKLKSSAINPEVARERGYVSADTKTGLHRHGFSLAQCEVMRDGVSLRRCGWAGACPGLGLSDGVCNRA